MSLNAEQTAALDSFKRNLAALKADKIPDGSWTDTDWHFAGPEAYRSGQMNPMYVVVTHADKEVVRRANSLAKHGELPPGTDPQNFVYIPK